MPSFALVRVLTSNNEINDAALRKECGHPRDLIIETARAGSWTDADFAKVGDALAFFLAHAIGNKKAWQYVYRRINMKEWARGVKRVR